MNDHENDLTNFELTCKIGLGKSTDAQAQILPKSGKFSFDAAAKRFSAATDTPSVQIELTVENLVPLAKNDCVQGRKMIIEFTKSSFKFNQLLLSDLSEGDKQLIHKCLLKLVGVKRGKINKPAPGGNKKPYPGQNNFVDLALKAATSTTPKMQRTWMDRGHGLASMAAAAAKTQKMERPNLVQNNLPSSAAVATPPKVQRPNPIQNNFAGSASTTAAVATTPKMQWTSPVQNNLASSAAFALTTPPPKVQQKSPVQSNTNLTTAAVWPYADDFSSPSPLRLPLFARHSISPMPEFSNKENDGNGRLVTPEDEIELPGKYTSNEFWTNLKMDEKIRSGMRGEWIKGQDEHLTVEGLLCLKDGEWMNADMMDAYLSFTSRRPEIDRVRYIPTYALLSYNRTKKIPTEWYWPLRDADLVLVPAHLNNNHWAMAVVDMTKRAIQLMDSMNNGFIGETKRKFMETILDILLSVAEQQGETEYLGERWEWTRDELLDVPQQKNGVDCGIFALLFGRFAAERRPINFGQQHIPYFRRRFCFDIVDTIN